MGLLIIVLGITLEGAYRVIRDRDIALDGVSELRGLVKLLNWGIGQYASLNPQSAFAAQMAQRWSQGEKRTHVMQLLSIPLPFDVRKREGDIHAWIVGVAKLLSEKWPHYYGSWMAMERFNELTQDRDLQSRLHEEWQRRLDGLEKIVVKIGEANARTRP